MPVLVVVGDIIGVLGGYLVSTARLGFNAATYLRNTVQFLEPWDVVSGLVKAAVFGFIARADGLLSRATTPRRGAQGVGRATTKSAVVSASVLILASNYLLTEVFFSS